MGIIADLAAKAEPRGASRWREFFDLFAVLSAVIMFAFFACQGLFNWISEFQSHKDSFRADSYCLAPSAYGFCFSLIGDFDAVPLFFLWSFVFALFLPICPSAVIRPIVSVIVYSVYTALVSRAWSHIKQEVAEAFQPSFTHANPPTTVSFIARTILVVASGFHVVPSLEFGWKQTVQ